MRFNLLAQELFMHRRRHWYLWGCISALLCIAVVASACSTSPQPASMAYTAIPETSSSVSKANVADSGSATSQFTAPAGGRSQTGPAAVSVPTPAISAPEPAVSVPAPAAVSVPASPYGPPSLDEIIFNTDVIAIVRPISAEPGTLTLHDTEGQTGYSPVVQARYEIVEYLKGDGDSEIIVNANDFTITMPSAEEALQAAESNLAAQISKLDGGEGVVFLRHAQYPDGVLDISRKASDTEWRQYNAQAGLFSAAGGISAVSTINSASVAGAEQREEFSLHELRERIEAMESLLREGEGIEGWEECIEAKLLHENYLSTWEFPSAFDVGPFPSGLPADSIVDEFSNRYPKQWFTGDNALLFYYGDYQITTTRPIPAGAYEVYAHFQEAQWMPCDYVAPPTTWRYNFESAEGVVHEAFFDPLDIAAAVGADDENGVLRPEWFETDDDGETVIERIEWRDGQVQMELSPSVDLDDYRMDFIALDGSVALRLYSEDAIEAVDDDEVATLAWGVCEQPWEDGDLLMLRIATGDPDDGVQATNDAECLAAAQEQVTADTAEPTATPDPTPTPTAEPTREPETTATHTPIATATVEAEASATPTAEPIQAVDSPAPESPTLAPQNLTAVLNENGSVTLTWDAPDDDSITGYQILRQRSTQGESTLSVYVEDTGSTGTTYTDTEVAPGIQHVYRVKAVNDAGVNEPSDSAQVGP